MATIDDYLEQIATATYGRDVRDSIVNAIRKCYEDLPKKVNRLSFRDQTAQGHYWGDINNDGVVDLTDSNLALQYSIGADPGAAAPEAGDFGGIGHVTSEDARQIANFVSIKQSGDRLVQLIIEYEGGETIKTSGIINLNGLKEEIEG